MKTCTIYLGEKRRLERSQRKKMTFWQVPPTWQCQGPFFQNLWFAIMMIVVVMLVVMSFHQTKFTQHEQTFIQGVHQLTRKEGCVHRSKRIGGCCCFLSTVPIYLKTNHFYSKQGNSMEDVFITYLASSFLGLLFLLYGWFMELLRQMPFGGHVLGES